jgi:hypothetical protein
MNGEEREKEGRQARNETKNKKKEGMMAAVLRPLELVDNPLVTVLAHTCVGQKVSSSRQTCYLARVCKNGQYRRDVTVYSSGSGCIVTTLSEVPLRGTPYSLYPETVSIVCFGGESAKPWGRAR